MKNVNIYCIYYNSSYNLFKTQDFKFSEMNHNDPEPDWNEITQQLFPDLARIVREFAPSSPADRLAFVFDSLDGEHLPPNLAATVCGYLYVEPCVGCIGNGWQIPENDVNEVWADHPAFDYHGLSTCIQCNRQVCMEHCVIIVDGWRVICEPCDLTLCEAGKARQASLLKL